MLASLLLLAAATTFNINDAPPQAIPTEVRRALREDVRSAFTHAYDHYMAHAMPSDVLNPLSCRGEDSWGAITLTLIDTLDTLAIMGNATEFERGVRWCIDNIDFDRDETVSLFETNIRVLGGLLAAHALGSDRRLGLLSESYPDGYGGGLLPLAIDLGNRLLPALQTASGIPFGSINLRHGVSPTESPVTCTAAAGTLLLEFGALSRYTGDPRYEAAAKRAALAVWQRRSEIDLLGAHVHIHSGVWTQPDSGIGRGIDSFYEYMLKGHMLFGDAEYLAIFHDSYHAALKHLKQGPW
jgi:mannosidase alpha-like ER degradation enhancer 2